MCISGKSPNRISFDYIELIDRNGKKITLTADFQDFAHDDETGEFDIRLKGVMINNRYANGKLNRVKFFKKISEYQVYDYKYNAELQKGENDIVITNIEFDDNGKLYKVSFKDAA